MRYNTEIYDLYNKVKVLVFMKLRGLQWAGHVVRMDDERMPKKALQQTIYGKRAVGKSTKRWEDAVREDSIKLLGTKAWKTKSQDRQLEATHRGGQGSIWAVASQKKKKKFLLEQTDASEVHNASTIGAIITLMTEIVRTSETSVYSNKTTRRYTLEGSHLDFNNGMELNFITLFVLHCTWFKVISSG
jgi:hypothetical protein